MKIALLNTFGEEIEKSRDLMANASSKLQCSSLVVVFFCFVVAFNLIVVMYRVMVSVKKQFSYSTSLQGLATKKNLLDWPAW